MSYQEIYNQYLIEREARKAAGFNMPANKAIEDTAMLLDISIHDVCKSISFCEF